MDPLPRVMEIKAKINKWDLIKLKCFCTAKETINKMKRQPIECEKIFANNVTDKKLSVCFKQHIWLNIKKTPNNLIKKWAELNRHSQRGNADGQQAHEKMLNITNHQGNANQNHSEIPTHTCQNGYHQKEHK